MKELSIKLKERFCKDNKISMSIFESPIFEHRLELIGKLTEYKTFEKMINTRYNGDEQQFFEDYNKVKDNAITYIKNSPGFIDLNSADMNTYAVKNNISTSNVFKETNIGKTFISIDIIKANFSSLVRYASTKNLEFYNTFNYAGFMKRFTDNNYFIQSKYIRQVIFGNCNPKRQVTYSKYLINKVLEDMISQGIISKEQIYSLAADELMLQNIDNVDTINRVYEYTSDLKNTLVPLKFELFKLGKIKNTTAFIKNILPDNTVELKCVNPMDAAEINRFVKGLEQNDEDLYFMQDGRKAKFTEHKELEIVYNRE